MSATNTRENVGHLIGRAVVLFFVCTPFHPVCWAIWTGILYGTGVWPR